MTEIKYNDPTWQYGFNWSMGFDDLNPPFCLNLERCEKERQSFADCPTVNSRTHQKHDYLWNKFVENQEQ